MNEENSGSELEALSVLVASKKKPVSLKSPSERISPLQITTKGANEWNPYTVKPQELKLGEEFVLQVHTRASGFDAIAVNNRLIVERNVKHKRTRFSVHAVISSVGFPILNAAINFDVLSTVEADIKLNNHEWFTKKYKQKHAGINRSNEVKHPKDILSVEGLMLGNLIEGESSNFLSYFEIVEYDGRSNTVSS